MLMATANDYRNDLSPELRSDLLCFRLNPERFRLTVTQGPYHLIYVPHAVQEQNPHQNP